MLKLIPIKMKKSLEIFIYIYFSFVWIIFRKLSFFLFFFFIPLAFLLFLVFFLKQKEEKKLLNALYSLLVPLESQMKLGSSFINAWQKSIEPIPFSKIKTQIQKISDVLKFQNIFSYPDKKIEFFVKDLIIIHKSSNPLKRLGYLKRKVKVEQSFQIKSERALLQTRIQSFVLSVLYFGLLAWTITAYGKKYIHFIMISFLFFFIGLFWVLKIGRRMKWTI